VLLLHAFGAMPFGLGLLFFWSDMSRSAFAADRCAAEALGLALLYVWMKTWHSRFMTALHAQVAGLPDPPWPARRVLRTAAIQTIIHATAFPVLTLAAIAVLPLAWCVTFYQNAVLAGNGEARPLHQIVRQSWALAVVRPLQTQILLSVLSLCALFVFLELLLGMLFLPELLRLLTGVQTVFTRSGPFALNSTLLAVAGVLCYLSLDPLLKAVCVLRCFREQAASTGEDLLVALRRLRERRRAGLRCLLCGTLAALVLALGTARAEAPPAQATAPRPAAIDPSALRQHLERTLQHPRYSWRLPRVRPPRADAEQAGTLLGLFRQLTRWAGRAVDTCLNALRDLMRWLGERLRAREPRPQPGHGPAYAWERIVPYLVVAATSVVIAVLTVVAWRAWRRRRAAPAVGAVAVAVPDLGWEPGAADQLPHADWLQAARALVARGDLRGGLRAAYLASLALLAERRLIALARSKSNLDYRRELARRAAQRPAAIDCFAAIVRAFDRVWYGQHSPTLGLLEALFADLDRMRSALDT
jgi:hypothetical protein